MNKANAKAIHIAKSRKKPTAQPKLVNKYVLPTLTKEKVRPHNNVYKSLGSKWLN